MTEQEAAEQARALLATISVNRSGFLVGSPEAERAIASALLAAVEAERAACEAVARGWKVSSSWECETFAAGMIAAVIAARRTNPAKGDEAEGRVGE